MALMLCYVNLIHVNFNDHHEIHLILFDHHLIQTLILIVFVLYVCDAHERKG